MMSNEFSLADAVQINPLSLSKVDTE